MNKLKRYLQQHGTDEFYQPQSVTEPTNFPPGTRAKLELLAYRVANGQSLFHKDDAEDYEQTVPGSLPPRARDLHVLKNSSKPFT